MVGLGFVRADATAAGNINLNELLHIHEKKNSRYAKDDNPGGVLGNMHNNDPDDLCTVPRRRFFELHDMLVALSISTSSLVAEVGTLSTMLGGNPAATMYHEQKARAEEAWAELEALRAERANGADQ